jgi:hypothetical protein
MNTNKQTPTLIIILVLIVIIAIIITIISKNKKVAVPVVTTPTEETSNATGTTTHYAFATDVYQKDGETFIVLDYVDVITCTEEKYKNDRNVCDENGVGISPGGNLNLKNENPKLRTFSLKNTKISLLQAYTDKNPDSSGQPKQVSVDEFYKVLVDSKTNPLGATKYYGIGFISSEDAKQSRWLIPSGSYHTLFSATEKDGQLVELFQNYQA